jgi:Flp pilus assembly protein TadB
MSGNYGSFDDTAAEKETKPRIPYEFNSVREYNENKSVLTIGYRSSVLDTSDDVPEQLRAVGVTVDAWGKFVADMNSALKVKARWNFLYSLCSLVVLIGVMFLVVYVPLNPWFLICTIPALIVCKYGVWDAYLHSYSDKQLDLCCEEMATMCGATLYAVSAGGYASKDLEESHMEKREEKDQEGRVTNILWVRVFDMIPKHIQFTTVEKGRPAKKLV